MIASFDLHPSDDDDAIHVSLAEYGTTLTNGFLVIRRGEAQVTLHDIDPDKARALARQILAHADKIEPEDPDPIVEQAIRDCEASLVTCRRDVLESMRTELSEILGAERNPPPAEPECPCEAPTAKVVDRDGNECPF